MTDIKCLENQHIAAFIQEKMDAVLCHYEQRLMELQSELNVTKQHVRCLQDTLEMHGDFILIGWCSIEHAMCKNAVPIIINSKLNILPYLKTIDTLCSLIPIGHMFDEDGNKIRDDTVVELELSQLYKKSVRNIDIVSLMCNYEYYFNRLKLTLTDNELNITLHSMDCNRYSMSRHSYYTSPEEKCEDRRTFLNQYKESIETIENKYPGLFAISPPTFK